MGLSLGRVIGAGIFFVLVGWLAPLPCGADQVWPSTHWAKADDPAALGWSTEKLTKAEEYTRTYSPTAVVIIQDGKVIASWGDSSHKVNVRSVRKSLLSALCGIGVAEGRIRLDETVGELGIDDRAPGLSETEKQANIRDLLMSRSGIYHAAAYEAPDAKAKRPPRAVILREASGITTIGTSTRSASSIRSWWTTTSFTHLRSESPSRSAWRTSRQTTENSFSRPRPTIRLTLSG